MANKRREHDRACRCDRADAGCAALAVQRLSRSRVQELAEEIWTLSNGTAVPEHPQPDPRGSRPGASAQAAYRRRRHKEREQWRHRRRSRRAWLVAAAVLGVGVLATPVLGPGLGWRLALVAGLGAWWRLRFHPSASARLWRRQAVAQRRTAEVLAQLEREGWLVLHDVALPGWSASLDHLAIGPTGAWAIESWQHRTGSPRHELTWKAPAVADSLVGTGIPVRPLLCAQVVLQSPGRRRVQGIPLVARRRLPDTLRRGSRVEPSQVQRASARALEVLRPAA
jgi:hypothetical protein